MSSIDGLPNIAFIGTLYPFQQKVVDWSKDIDKGVIGLDMGLGKTIITIAIMCKKQYQHTVIVVPLPIIEQWRTSLHKFTDICKEQVCVYHGRSRKNKDLTKYRVILTTYDVVRRDAYDTTSPLLICVSAFDCLVLDEAHRIRNEKTNTFQACQSFSSNISSKWLLTGTVIHNKFKDFYNLCEFLELPSLTSTLFSICEETRSKWRNKYYYRLMKEQCDLKLPDKEINQISLQFMPDSVYYAIRQDLVEAYEDYLDSKSREKMSYLLVKILRLRQCCNHPLSMQDDSEYKEKKKSSMVIPPSPKFNEVLNVIKKTPPGDKLIIFSQWAHTLYVLEDFLKQNGIVCLMYNGSLDITDRTRLIRDFSTGTKNILLITLTSGGVGLDLSFANHLILLDSWWNMALEKQAIDRVYRIGQIKKVTIYRFYMEESIENWLVKMKEEKGKVDEQFHTKTQIYDIDRELLTEYLHKYL